LEAASKLLLASGGQGVRMADIATAAGVSRQAVYLHFESRTELMIATVRYLDEVHGLEARLRGFREATSGIAKLDAFIEFWGNYIPEIYGVAKALMDARHTDDAAAAAWNDRMNSVRSGCQEVIEALERDRRLAPEWAAREAAELLWAILSIPSWELLTIECGWTTAEYVHRITVSSKRILVQAT
jgi:AcrR family transcriptional regulator